MTLTYQPIPEADHEQFVRLEIHGFGDSPQESRDWLAKASQRWRLRGLYDAGQLVSQLVLMPQHIQAGSRALPFGGFASVATPPEHRRRGYVARLLREACAELQAEGTALAVLYPFKQSFYQRFGWATFLELRRYSGAPRLFASFRRPEGRFEPAGLEQIPELDAIYRGALRGRFGPLVRDQHWWEHEVLAQPNKLLHSYIWRDAAGRGRAYLIYWREPHPDGPTLRCREIVALDPQARAQLFGFLAAHEDAMRQVIFSAPSDAPVNALLPDPLQCEIVPWFMLRLLDVAAALSSFAAPGDCAGRLTLAVADDWLEHNQGVFELEIARGAVACRRLPDDTPADLACDVRTLAQLYSRYLRPRTAAAFGMLEVHHRPALALADQLFAGLAPFCSDFF